MRVALLTYNARAGDAIGNQVAEKVAFFGERGADVRAFLHDDRALHPGVRPSVTLVPPLGDEEGWSRLLASFDLLIADYSQYYPLLEALLLLGEGPPRVVFDYHGVTPPELWPGHCPPAVAEGSWRRGLVWCADAALAHSDFAVEELCHATDFPPERVYRLGYPLDLERFASGAPTRDLRRKLGLGEATLLLFVGRLAPNKRAGLLVEALARMPASHAVLIGDMTDLYHEEAARCRRRAAERRVADRLHLLGRVSEQELIDAYRSADVLVMPSVHEGFCIPVIEALACGVPVVAARAAALPETVGPAGRLFTPDDGDDLTRQLQHLLDEDESTKAARRRQGREWVRQFGRCRWREQFGEAIEQILHAPPPARRVPTPAELLRDSLLEAERRQRLPVDYLDVSEGRLAGAKRWLKRKLLGNFKQAYVDVLSRQQSAYNRHLLTAVQELRMTVEHLESRLKELEDRAPVREEANS